MAIRQDVLNVKTMPRRPGSKWSGWQTPVLAPKLYTMFCCDCGLAHQFQFRVVADPADPEDLAVQYRVSRSEGYTKAKRESKTEAGHIVRLKKGETFEAKGPTMLIILQNGRKLYLKRGK